MRLLRLQVAALLLVASLSVAACSTEASSSANASGDAWPYAIALVKAPRIADPVLGPELVNAPDVPDGSVLIDVHVRIENDTNPDSGQITPPDLWGFLITDSEGTTFSPVGGVGMYRIESSPAASDAATDSAGRVRHRGPSEMMALASEPGASYVLNPQFVVPEASTNLVIRFTPIPSYPHRFIEFKLD